MVQEGHRIQRRGPGLNLKLQTLPYRSGDGAWCEHLHGAHGAVAVPLPGRCVGGWSGNSP